jgi:hypothetical protein
MAMAAAAVRTTASVEPTRVYVPLSVRYGYVADLPTPLPTSTPLATLVPTPTNTPLLSPSGGSATATAIARATQAALTASPTATSRATSPTTTPSSAPSATSVPTSTATPLPPEATQDLYNCSDFRSQAAAQAFLRRYPSDPSRLDANRDGIACESNPAPYDLTPVPR